MWPATTSTVTPSGTRQPVTRTFLSEPSGFTENRRPPPLASSTNNLPCGCVTVAPFGTFLAYRNCARCGAGGHHRKYSLPVLKDRREMRQLFTSNGRVGPVRAAGPTRGSAAKAPGGVPRVLRAAPPGRTRERPWGGRRGVRREWSEQDRPHVPRRP